MLVVYVVIAVAPVVGKVVVTVLWDIEVHGLIGYFEEQKDCAGAYEERGSSAEYNPVVHTPFAAQAEVMWRRRTGMIAKCIVEEFRRKEPNGEG